MSTQKDNTEVLRMLRDVKDSIWRSVTPMKDTDKNFHEYLSSFSDRSGSSSISKPNFVTRLNFNFMEDSALSNDASFKSIQTPDSLKRKLMMREVELQASQAKLKERESMISILEPANKKICVSLENKLEECRKQNQIDSQKIEELRSKLKWAQGEAAHAKSKILEVERQKKVDIDKYELKILLLQQECSSLKEKMENIKSEKAETVRKLNIEIGRLELKINILSEDVEKSQEYIETLKRQKGEFAEKAALSNALQKELNEAQNKIKILENKIEADKDASLVVASRQADLKLFDEVQKENKMLKEEVAKNRENNITLYQEKMWSLQEKLNQAEKKSVVLVKLQAENEQLKSKLAQWEELFDDQSISFKSPRAFSMKISQYQKREASLTHKISQLSNHCETLEKKNQELELAVKALNRRVQQYQVSSPNQESIIRRLQRKVIILTKERDNCRKLLDSYLSESTMAGVSLHSEQMSSLEDMNMEYKKLLEKTEKEVELLNEKIKTLNASNNTDQLYAEIKKLKDENSLLLAKVTNLEKEKTALENKCLEQNKDGNDENGHWSGKILHMRFNPLDNANKRYLEAFQKLQTENDVLKKRIKVLEEEGALATDVTLKVEQKLAKEGSDSDIRSLREKLASAEKQQKYIIDTAKAKNTDFREGVFLLTGYRVDMPISKRFKLTHSYAESKDDYLLFQIESGGVQLLETEYSKQLLDKMELYLHQHDSFPAFLASLTMDLFNRQTFIES